jgi:hypothetical protein
MAPKTLRREPGGAAAGRPRRTGRRLRLRTFLPLLAWLALFPGGGDAGEGQWKLQRQTAKVPPGAAYQDAAIVVFVFPQEVWLAKDPFKPWDTWGDCLSLKVPGAALGKLHQADCELKSDKQLFVFTGDSARKLIEAFTQGTAITIRDCFRGNEFTVPLQGFNAVYAQALQGQFAPEDRQ